MASKELPEQDSTSDNKPEDKDVASLPPSNQEVKDLKGNFEQQQAMIAQLRDILKKKERQHEMEDYAARLAKMKPRLIRGRGRSKEKENVSHRIVSSKEAVGETLEHELERLDKDILQVDDVSHLSEVDILHQPLSKDSSQESSDQQVSSELSSFVAPPPAAPLPVAPPPVTPQESGGRAKILLLRKQLEDNRIKFERQQRENADKKATMDEMKDRIQQLRAEVEHRDTIIQSLQEVDSLQINDPNIQHLYKQILQKDNTLLDLSDQINNLEVKVQDQYEQLEEKNKIIAARTEAVSLVTKDKDEKLIKAMQELEEIKFSMRQMQMMFTEKEDTWHCKENILDSVIEEKNKKIIILEENYSRIESIRFELSTKNAELQEKIVTMQAESVDLRGELSNAKNHLNKQSNEIGEVKQKLVRAEAYGQKKLKAMEKQIRTLSNDSDFSERILDLQNQIAELEDEKGNLQLKLVDFDELKSQVEKWKSSVKLTEDKVDQLNAELFSQISALNKIQQEKMTLVDQLNAKCLAYNSLEENACKYQSEYEEIKQAKIVLELRICALEEERDIAVKSTSILENEQNTINIVSLEAKSAKLEETTLELQNEITIKNSKLYELEHLLQDKENLAIVTVEEKLSKESENQCLISMLAEKESALSSQSIVIDQHNSLVEQLHHKISVCEKSNLNKDEQIFQMQSQIEDLHKELNNFELRMENINRTVLELEDVIFSNHNLIKTLKESEKSLNSVLVEKEKAILILEGEICSMGEELSKKESMAANHLEKLEKLEKLLEERDNEIRNLEHSCIEKSDELVQRGLICQKLEEDLINAQTYLKDTESKLTAECEAISCMLDDRDNKIELLEQQVDTKITELRNSETMLSKFETELCEKNKYFDNLLLDKGSLVNSLQQQIKELSCSLEKSTEEVNFMKNSLDQKDVFLSQLQNDKFLESDHLQQLKEHSIKQNEKVVILENEVSDLKSALITENDSYQQLLEEFKNAMSDAENKIWQNNQAIETNDIEIRNLKESLELANIELSNSKEQFERLEQEINEKAQFIIKLQELLSVKEEEFQTLNETNAQYLLQVQLKLTNIQNSLEVSQTQNEELNSKLVESLKNAKEHQASLEASDYVKKELEAQLVNLQQIIESKNNMIESLKTDYNSTFEDKDETNRAMMELQSQLQYSEEQFNQMVVYYKAQISEEQLSQMSILDEKQKEVDYLQTEHDKLQQELFEMDFSNKNIINDLENKLKEASITLLKLQELKEQKKLDDENLELNLGQTVLGKQESVLEDQLKANELLKNQLEEAQQQITRLETILATQSESTEVKQKSVDDWGDIDLGEPSFYSSNSAMQTSLMEKDKALTVIQEQLKISLEQVNTANDEKKLVQHQMKTLEAKLSHDEECISRLKEEIQNFEMQNSVLSKQLQEMQYISTSRSPPIDNDQLNANTVMTIKEPPRISTEEERNISVSAASWFQSSNSANLGSDFISQVDSSHSKTEDQQVLPQKESSLASEHHQLQESLPSQDASGQNYDTILDLQYKLSWYEENWAQWTGHYNQLQECYQTAQQEIMDLKSQLTSDQFSSNLNNEQAITSQYNELQLAYQSVLEEKSVVESQMEQLKQEYSVPSLANADEHILQTTDGALEDHRLKEREAQVNELQLQVEALQNQCLSLESLVKEAEANLAKLHENEILYGELKTFMQESEIKQEGSKSRVQELELMVQSAEAEISRLRTEIQTLATAGKVLENERGCLQEEFNNLKEELRKCSSERDRFETEMDRLQNEASSLNYQLVDLQNLLQRRESEGDQLKSEVEMLQGENDRMRSCYEIVESEGNRLRNEVDFLTQTNQMLSAQKESIEIELQRLGNSAQTLSSERDHFRGEMQRLTELSTSAESEISRLKQEEVNLSTMSLHYQDLERRYAELQSLMQVQTESPGFKQSSHGLPLEDVDWGTDAKMEDEHIQRSSSVERVLQDEVDLMKRKLIELEKEKNQVTDELQASKLKNGKMIQKLKATNNKTENLRKELEKLRAQAGGFSDLDQALEAEYKAQITRAENEKDEIKTKLDEMEKEKRQMTSKIDVLESAQEKYLEMKELQDVSLRHLSVANKNLESQVATLEWKISEMEETFEEEKRSLTSAMEPQDKGTIPFSDASEVPQLRQNIIDLEHKISDLIAENSDLKNNIAETESKIIDLSADNENLQSLLNTLREAKNKAESDITSYKTSFLELDSQHSLLIETNKQTEVDLKRVNQQLLTLRSAYDVLYDDYQHLQDERDSFKYELGILTGKKEKLQEEVQSLNNQLEALKEEEEEEIIRALQDECSELREQNNVLKDEIIRLGEVTKLAEESSERTKHSLDQQVEIQEILRADFLAKSDLSEQQRLNLEKSEREKKYLNAEIASLKMKSLQQQQALEDMEPKLQEMKDKLQISQEQNQKLIEQVKIAENSLAKMATGRTSGAFLDEQRPRSLSVAAESELEAALTSLHLRDLRCQQLSLEINKLLEERDALQLKLSASLRQSQELSRELNQSQHLPAATTPPPSLNEKLAELRKLNSGLEKKALNTMVPTLPTFVSHTAPSTPTATRYMDHTVSRVNQGSSTTIMDWLLGKSTPKEILHV